MSGILSAIDAANYIKDIIESENSDSIVFEFMDVKIGGFSETLDQYAEQMLGVKLNFMYNKEDKKLIAHYHK